jgi:hypothetical protein
VHKKGGIISLGCDRFGLQRSPLAYGRLKFIATARYRHGTLSPRHFIATAFIATAFIATALRKARSLALSRNYSTRITARRF